MPRRAAPCTGYVCRPLTMDELPRLCQSLEALAVGSLFDSAGLRLSALYAALSAGEAVLELAPATELSSARRTGWSPGQVQKTSVVQHCSVPFVPRGRRREDATAAGEPAVSRRSADP